MSHNSLLLQKDEKPDQGKITWQWTETQLAKSNLAERIASAIKAIRGYDYYDFSFLGIAIIRIYRNKTKEEVARFIRGRRLTYGDLPEDFQDSKDDVAILNTVSTPPPFSFYLIIM